MPKPAYAVTQKGLFWTFQDLSVNNKKGGSNRLNPDLV
jgi:hypothetical protein